MSDLHYVYAYDVGTSSVKATIIDSKGQIHAQAVEEYPIYHPHPSWVEQEPEDYWQAIVKTTHKLKKKTPHSLDNLLGLVFATQAMGIIPVDATGKILYRNISWVDGRAEKQALKYMRRIGGRHVFKALIGIEFTGKDVIPKLMWLKDNEREIYNQTKFFLDVNGFLKFKATGKMVAEWSGACSYSFDLKKKNWTPLIFRIGGIDVKKLPPLVRSIDIVGTLTEQAAKELNLPDSVKVFGGCDDTQSAAIGSTAIGEGQAHIYLGTSAWVGVSTENIPKFKHGAVVLQSADPRKNLIVGITESAGIYLEWAARELYKGQDLDVNTNEIYTLMDSEITQVPAGSDHLIATPWVLGERCPVSTTTTRGTFFNLGLDHTRAHLVKAIDEGIGYNLRWIIENYEKDFNFVIDELKILGGASQSKEWMQILADITHRKIITLNHPRMGGSLGVAMCAFVGGGIFESFETIKAIMKKQNEFLPNPAKFAIYDKLFKDYQNLYFSLKKTYKIANSIRFT